MRVGESTRDKCARVRRALGTLCPRFTLLNYSDNSLKVLN